MTKQNGIARAAGRVLGRVLSKFSVWTITSTDDSPLVIRAPIPIFGIDSVVYSVRSIISGLRLRKGGEM